MYYIKASDQDTYLHVAGNTDVGNELNMHECTASKDYSNCQWMFMPSPTRPGMYYIKASDQDTYVHSSGGTDSGSMLNMHDCPQSKDYPNCQWSLTPPEAEAPEEYPEEMQDPCMHACSDACYEACGDVCDGGGVTSDGCRECTADKGCEACQQCHEDLEGQDEPPHLSECADGQKNNCFEDHCGPDASMAHCLEEGGGDPDCCALKSSGSCGEGYVQKAQHEHVCFSEGTFDRLGMTGLGSAYTTCCVPKNKEGETASEALVQKASTLRGSASRSFKMGRHKMHQDLSLK
jgi:hypothetical protein